jgi:hypothetical protein
MITKQSEAIIYILLLGEESLSYYHFYNFKELRIKAVSDE